MKKIFVFCTFIGVLALGACSSEEDVNLNSVNNGHSSMRLASALETEYNNLIASTEYSDYIAAVDDFVDKMNFTGSTSSLTEKDDILNWISTNISSTGFTNYAEAEDDYDGLNTKYNLMFAANKPFFEELQLSTKGELAIIMYPKYEFEPAGECEDACNSALSGCTSSQTAQHAAAMETIYDGVDMNDENSKIEANKKASFQMTAFALGLQICSDNHQSCLVTCLVG